MDALHEAVDKNADEGHPSWASFNWTERLNLETALRQQEALTELINEQQLVVKTAVLEEVLDAWPSAMLRRAQTSHSDMIWLSQNGLVLNRMTPLPRVQ